MVLDPHSPPRAGLPALGTFAPLDSVDSLMARVRSARRSDPAPDGFGARLVRLRQARGLTQEELGAVVGLSNRMIAYYERDDAEPPGPMLASLATALRVTTDELLGLAPITQTMRPRTARLMKRLQQIEELPAAEQRAVLKMVDALLEHRRATPTIARSKRKAS
ncbi:MAG: helix-turn-helix transcriptional regulator [Gemmatimonadaceae bacterium]